MEDREEITALVDREVYTTDGVFVGEVEDVRLDLDAETVTGLALGNLNRELVQGYAPDAQGIMVPYRWVRAVGDVILINDIIERLPAAEDEAEAVA